MYSAEVLSQLRTLNWLTRERRHLPLGSAQAVLLGDQEATIRQRLPSSILQYHDQLAKTGKSSVAAVTGSLCGACYAILPNELLSELKAPGSFRVCPTCGVFIWQDDPSVEPGRPGRTEKTPGP
jgi:hypothetical protein